MIPLISIYIGGTLTILIGFFHTRFYKLYKWKEEFEKITTLNSLVIYTIHLALMLLFFILGSISIIYAFELSKSVGLAFGFNTLFSLFWLWRFIWQLVYFKKVRGQKKSRIGIVLTIAFAILSLTYIIPVVYSY